MDFSLIDLGTGDEASSAPAYRYGAKDCARAVPRKNQALRCRDAAGRRPADGGDGSSHVPWSYSPWELADVAPPHQRRRGGGCGRDRSCPPGNQHGVRTGQKARGGNWRSRDPEQMAVYPLAVPYLLNPVGITILIIASDEVVSFASRRAVETPESHWSGYL
jgi:hypothetical protein